MSQVDSTVTVDESNKSFSMKLDTGDMALTATMRWEDLWAEGEVPLEVKQLITESLQRSLAFAGVLLMSDLGLVMDQKDVQDARQRQTLLMKMMYVVYRDQFEKIGGNDVQTDNS